MGNRIAALVAGIAVITGLAGCGGGGGGGSAPTPVASAALTTANATVVAGATTDATLTSSTFDDLAGLGVLGSPAVAAVQSGADASVTLAKNTARLQATTAEVMVGPETISCDIGGTMTITADIQNPEMLTAGDTFTLSYVNCDFGQGPAVDGSISFTVTSFQGDLVSEQFVLGFSLQINNLQMAEAGDNLSLDGDLTMSLDTTGTLSSVSVSSNSLTLTDGVDTVSLTQYSTTADVDLSVFPEAFTLQSSGFLMSSDFDGEVQFNTTVALQGNGEGNPVSGELVITGANGATITVIPLDAQNVRLELDLDGDGAVDPNGVVDLTWQQLLDTSA
ncbi:MAG: hypothetical protein ACR2QV_16115 [Gammaproteobacteria bacterium]